MKVVAARRYLKRQPPHKRLPNLPSYPPAVFHHYEVACDHFLHHVGKVVLCVQPSFARLARVAERSRPRWGGNTPVDLDQNLAALPVDTLLVDALAAPIDTAGRSP